MRYRFEFRPYQRPFRQPLHTHHGIWRCREGILLRLTSSAGAFAYGEIAPLPDLGSETLAQALAVCQQFPTELTTAAGVPEAIATLPDHLPACQFGFQSAWEQLTASPASVAAPLPNSYLLPTGSAALSAWQSPFHSGFTTFKWKIGTAPFSEEQAIFQQLSRSLPPGTRLRLDANGGLDWDASCRWLEACEQAAGVEFLEQPLAADRVELMLKLSQRYATPIALDESVATVAQLEACYRQGWRGIFVIKAAIAGSPPRLRQFCRQPDVDVVWSSALETAVARRFIADRLIAALPPPTRAIGFGVDHWFNDTLSFIEFERLWQTF